VTVGTTIFESHRLAIPGPKHDDWFTKKDAAERFATNFVSLRRDVPVVSEKHRQPPPVFLVCPKPGCLEKLYFYSEQSIKQK